jgi:hypothetical protein
MRAVLQNTNRDTVDHYKGLFAHSLESAETPLVCVPNHLFVEPVRVEWQDMPAWIPIER